MVTLAAPAVFLYPMLFRNFCLFILGCTIAACTNSAAPPVSKREITLAARTNGPAMAPQKKIAYADSVLRIPENNTMYLRAWRLDVYGRVYFGMRLFSKGLRYINASVAITDKQNFADTAWANLFFSNNISKAHLLYNTGNYTAAIDVYFKIKEQTEKTGKKCGYAYNIDIPIAFILYKQQKYGEAKKYFALAFSSMNNCTIDEFSARPKQEMLDDMGLCFAKQGDNDSAMVYYHKALNVIEHNKFHSDPAQDKATREICRGVVMGNMAQVYVKLNKLDSAEALFKQNIYINSVIAKTEIRDAQLSQMHLAGLYDLKGAYPKMKSMLDDLRKNLDTIANTDAELGWLRLMAGYCGANNLPKQGITYYKRYLLLTDSLDHVKTAGNQADADKELTTREQQQDITLLQADNDLSHSYLWVTVSLSVMALAIVALIYYYYRRGKKNIEVLTLLNREVGEQKEKLEFAVLELEKSNTGKERILRTVAHDLRDPIGGASSLVNVVLNAGLPKARERQNLNLVEKTLTNSLTLINELLELEFSPDHIILNKKPADINEMVKQCTSLMRLIAAKKNQKLLLSALPKPLIIDLDKERLERTVNNLVGNAIKFSPAGGEITITLEQTDGSVLLSIKDNGIGIPPEMQNDLFNTMSGIRRTGTAGEKSFGLGLSICKQIVEAHQGKIWLQSTPGSGSVFYVELPLGEV